MLAKRCIRTTLTGMSARSAAPGQRKLCQNGPKSCDNSDPALTTRTHEVRMAADHMPELGQSVQISSLPAPGISGIYFLYDKGEVVYVGQGRNVRARIGAHITECLKFFDAISFIACHRSELLDRERAFIRRLRPKYNRCNVARRARQSDPAREWLRAQQAQVVHG